MKKRALGVWCVFEGWDWRSADYGLFFLSGGRFFNGAEAELRRDGVAVFVGPCAFCLFFRVVRSCFLFWFWKFLFGIDKRRVFLYDVSINRNKNSNWRNIHVRRIY